MKNNIFLSAIALCILKNQVVFIQTICIIFLSRLFIYECSLVICYIVYFGLDKEITPPKNQVVFIQTICILFYLDCLFMNVL